MSSPRIALLHATPVAMEPIHNAFVRLWADAELINLLDDGLSVDRARMNELTEPMIERFVSLCRYAESTGADGLLVTCSAFGPAIERATRDMSIPVLKPNEAMFQAAIEAGNRIGMIATFPPALVTMQEEFAEESQRLGASAQLTSIVIPEAIEALRHHDVETHNGLIAERGKQFEGYDAVMLAHFSTSRAAPLLRTKIDAPVLTAPDAAVARMRQRVLGTSPQTLGGR